MSARRCTQCAINWPSDPQHMKCPNCDGATWFSPTSTPDPKEDRQPVTAPLDVGEASPAYVHRVERYLQLGFTEVDAHVMAAAKDRKGFYWYHGDVAKAIAAGLSHEGAVSLYA